MCAFRRLEGDAVGAELVDDEGEGEDVERPPRHAQQQPVARQRKRLPNYTIVYK